MPLVDLHLYTYISVKHCGKTVELNEIYYIMLIEHIQGDTTIHNTQKCIYEI